MNLEGLEMIAVLVVLVLFVKVLEQFGLFEPVSLEGNGGGGCWPLWGHGGTSEGSLCCFGDGGGKEEPPGPNPAGPAPMSPGDSPCPPQVTLPVRVRGGVLRPPEGTGGVVAHP